MFGVDMPPLCYRRGRGVAIIQDVWELHNTQHPDRLSNGGASAAAAGPGYLGQVSYNET